MTDQKRDDRERTAAATDAELDRVAAGSTGQDGNDLLIWNNGDGSDFNRGGAGNDVLIGGLGRDVL
jgi:Ca2+-binding RTX toxin-like protein